MSPYSQASFATPTTCIQTRSYTNWIKQYSMQINIASCVLLVAMALCYIVQVNAGASKGYQIHDLENKISELTLSNQQMELASNQAQSLETISHAVKMIGLVPDMQPKYIESSTPSYAFAK